MPSKVWSDKDERMYEHIVKSEHGKEGRPLKKARQIAAATVNKRRRRQGRAKSRRSAR
jgi:hypothetical protein